jgi:hypothetical protein
MSNPNSNSFRLVGAGKTFLSPTDFIVQVDTSAGAVTLVLPKIETILGTYATIQQFIGVRFVDISNNASVNNITIEGFERNTINAENTIVLNTDGVGGMISLIGTNQWNFVQNSVDGNGGGNGGGNYLLQELPTPSCVNYLDRNAIGKIYEYGIKEFDTTATSFILLDNGDVVSVGEPCCILVDETIIVTAPFFASDGTDPSKRAYFLAFKKSASDSTKLDFLTYVKVTSEEEVKFVDSGGGNSRLISETESTAILMNPNANFETGGDLSPSNNVKLVYNSATNTLTSEVVFPFPNPISALEIFNQLTGLSVVADNWKPADAQYLYNGQLDGTALMNGQYEGVWWVSNDDNTDFPVGKQEYNYVIGINFVTGETYLTDALEGVNNLTNFSYAPDGKPITFMVAHPKGVQFYLNDGVSPDNGNNNIGVTGIFSTLWTNNTQCIYLNSRCGDNGLFANTNGSYGNVGNKFESKLKYGYYDKEYIFQLGFSVDWYNGTANNIILWRWKLDSQNLEFETLQIPLAWSNASKSINYLSVTSANGYSLAFGYEGMVVNSDNFSPTINGIYWDDKEVNPVQLKSNLNFGSALLNSESYNLMATNSYGGYLVMIDSYDSVKF